jgi:predicted DNA-binding transcriptional regulator AlpA
VDRLLVMPHGDLPELVGTREIAERLGLAHPESVHAWRRRHPDFPEPVARLGIGLVWLWAEVREWASKTGRPIVSKGERR